MFLILWFWLCQFFFSQFSSISIQNFKCYDRYTCMDDKKKRSGFFQMLQNFHIYYKWGYFSLNFVCKILNLFRVYSYKHVFMWLIERNQSGCVSTTPYVFTSIWNPINKADIYITSIGWKWKSLAINTFLQLFELETSRSIKSWR